MNAYHWDAVDYAQNSQSQQRWATELIARLPLTGMEDVLDLVAAMEKSRRQSPPDRQSRFGRWHR